MPPHHKLLALALALLGLVAAGGGRPAAAQTSSVSEKTLEIERRVGDVLVGHGFENVAVAARNGVVTVWFENRIYRYDMTALGVVAVLAATEVEAAAPGTGLLELVPQNRGIPLISVSAPHGEWLRFIRADGTPEGFRGVLEVRTAGLADGAPLRADRPRQNRSAWRTDVRLRPLFGFDLGTIDELFLYTLEAAPEAVMTPFPGGLVTLQAALRIKDDRDPCGQIDPCGAILRPLRNTLTWGSWLPGNVLFTASGGIFPGDRYGFAGEAGRLLGDGQLELRAGGDVSGLLLFRKDVVEYSTLKQWSAFLAGTHRTPWGLDLETTVTVGRFREGELGARFDIARQLDEFRVGFFAIRNENDDVIGVTLRIPLPVRKYSTPSRFRATTVPAFPFTYRDSVEPVGFQVSFFDNLDRFRKRLYPTFIHNNVEDLRRANRYLDPEGRP